MDKFTVRPNKTVKEIIAINERRKVNSIERLLSAQKSDKYEQLLAEARNAEFQMEAILCTSRVRRSSR